MQTDYLTFGNLITTSDTPKVQLSKAIAVEEYLIISDEQTLHVGSKFKIDGFLSSDYYYYYNCVGIYFL